ncbi:MAG: cold-shock protein [Acidimicrobiales bacterium]
METATGTVTDFDDAAGYGTVTDSGGEQWFFHCTAIADGTRTIEIGTQVAFEIVAGRLGAWEASDLRPLQVADPPPS